MKKEPVVIIAAITAAVEAGIGMAVGFGLDWTPQQVASVMAFVIGVGGIASALWARSKVTPAAKD